MSDASNVCSLFLARFAIVVALPLVVLDLLIWLSICFAFATPMLISCLYEVFIDSRVLFYLKNRRGNDPLTLDKRALLLYVTLVGNLDLALEGSGEYFATETPKNQLTYRW